MNHKKKMIRHIIIGAILVSGIAWSLSFAGKGSASGKYPNGEILATVEWLRQHIADENLVIVDVRDDKYFDNRMIPGAIRMPWSLFRYDNVSLDLEGIFVGADKSQELFGKQGIGRNSIVVLYDSVKRDGGAIASYVFWALDVVGHAEKKILDGGIDAWISAGYELVAEPKPLAPVLYQAPLEELRVREVVDGRFIFNRLGDPYHQIIDVRSRDEYLGVSGSKSLRGKELSPGHIPTAVNLDYKNNWIDEATKKIRSYESLQEIYRGLDPNKSVIVYCSSGRRSAFSYFILKLMGIRNVYTYDASWQEWGNPENFFPIERIERKFAMFSLPGATPATAISTPASVGDAPGQKPGAPAGKFTGGYVSCGG